MINANKSLNMANLVKTGHLTKANEIKAIMNFQSMVSLITSRGITCGCIRPISCSSCRTPDEEKEFRNEKAIQIKEEETYHLVDDEMEGCDEY